MIIVVWESVPTSVSGKATGPSLVGPGRHNRGQELEVHLVDDPGSRRDDAQIVERRLRPAQQGVALAVPVVLALDVEGERGRRPEPVDLDRVVDDQVGGDERVDPGRVAAEVGHRVAHRGQVDDRRNAGEVLEDHPRRHERQLDVVAGRRPGSPPGERLDVSRSDDPAAGVAEGVLEQDLDRHRDPSEVHTEVFESAQPVEVGERRAEARPGIERIGNGHASSFAGVARLIGWKRTPNDEGLARA